MPEITILNSAFGHLHHRVTTDKSGGLMDMTEDDDKVCLLDCSFHSHGCFAEASSLTGRRGTAAVSLAAQRTKTMGSRSQVSTSKDGRDGSSQHDTGT
jgi:hypothetical protein